MTSMKFNGRTAERRGRDDSVTAAQSVRSDLAQLISVFDQQLANLSTDEEPTRRSILEAKAVAERGLQLSEKLIHQLGYHSAS